jgi:Phosphotransferase enzyme family
VSPRLLESSAQIRRDLATMWAAPVDVVDARGGDARPSGATVLHTFAVLPSTRRPRIVASSSPAATAATVRRFSHSTGMLGRSARVALAAAIRTGAAGLVFRDRLAVIGADGADSVVAKLAEIFGADVAIGMSVGSVRANRKPVLHVVTPDGVTLGFAKIALSPLACTLVRAEATNLRLLAGHDFEHLEVPEVIHHGRWQTHELLVMTALHAPFRRRPGRATLPVRAMAELAAFGGISALPLAESSWFAAVVSEAAETSDSSARRFERLLERLADHSGEHPVRFGSWHGDWGPWNMAWAGERVRLWDWERFATGVPYGLDALHYALAGEPEKASLSGLRESAAKALAPFSVDRHDTDLLLTLYVAALTARFLPDSLTEHGAQLRPRLVALLDLLEHLPPTGANHRLPVARSSEPARLSESEAQR